MTTSYDSHLLGRIPLFQGLSEVELALVTKGLRHVRFPARVTLTTATRSHGWVYILTEGAVKLQVDQADGGTAVVAVLGPGQAIGALGHEGDLADAATAETLEPSAALSMSAAHYQHLLRAIPALSGNVLHLLMLRLHLANQQILALATLGAEGRVAAQIRALADAYGQAHHLGSIQIPFRLTQGTLAAMTGLSRVRVNQVLQRFQEERIIALAPQYRLLLLDGTALVAYATMGANSPPRC